MEEEKVIVDKEEGLQSEYFFEFEKDGPYYAIASGDDCAQEDDKDYYDQVGYEEILEEYGAAYEMLGMIVNPKKQINIKCCGYPVVDFLQYVRFIYTNEGHKTGRKKFFRAMPALPYSERRSTLTELVLQWVILWGKLDSALDEFNVGYASTAMSHYGRILQSLLRKNHYKVSVPKNYQNTHNKLYFDMKKVAGQSAYAGAEVFVSLVKQYGMNTLASLVRYTLDKLGTANKEAAREQSLVGLVNEFSAELETRAPHKEVLARSLYDALTEDEQKLVGYKAETKSGVYISMIPEFVKLWESKTGIPVTPMILAGPKEGSLDEGSTEEVEIDVDLQNENFDSD
jgi:hypothetical protein